MKLNEPILRAAPATPRRRPGETFRSSDGQRYIAEAGGSLRRIGKEAELEQRMKQAGISSRQRRKLVQAARRQR